MVYGDIGTSPLYAIRESLGEHYDIEVVPANVLGVLSLVFWALLIVISVKYLAVVMRADNGGEGGILALTALNTPRGADHRGERRPLILLGLFGTALLYGDGAITPAISVLSAVEGVALAAPVLEPFVISIAVAILVGLFAVQRRGTAAVGAVFGPVMVIWFGVLAALGIAQIVSHPTVFAAINPGYAVQFFSENGVRGVLALGSVFLVVTGGEALYADMGHFGLGPIRLGWFSMVLPALLLNYFGQGALLISDPAAIDHPFFRMAPLWGLLPLVALATAATIIASQALISGVFSLTMQAIHLDYVPRMRIDHTSKAEQGQVYLGAVNWGLMLACVALVVGFRSSTALAAAYGVAVTSTMVITTLLFAVVARRLWGWSPLLTGAVTGGFLVIDLAFFGANLIKVPEGGWFPLVVGLLTFTLMTTWRRGRSMVYSRTRRGEVGVDEFLRSLRSHPPTRVEGTAVYMFPQTGRIPPALLANLRANHALHETVLLLAVEFADVPHVPRVRRFTVTQLEAGFWQVVLRYGFADRPDVPRDLEARIEPPTVDPLHTTYFLGRESIHPRAELPGMAPWRERLFALLHRNAPNAASLFRLPPRRVVEIGVPVEI